MPGVPPDALAQVKKGLRGLLGRKKKHQAQSASQPTPSLGAPSTSTTTAAAAAPAGIPSITTTESTPPPPQIQTPVAAGTASAKPTAPQTTPAEPTKAATKTSKSTGVEANGNSDLKPAAPAVANVPTSATPAADHGMSATSGPLGDQMVHEYSELGKDSGGSGLDTRVPEDKTSKT